MTYTVSAPWCPLAHAHALPISVYAYACFMYVYVYVYVCMCTNFTHIHAYTTEIRTHIRTNTYIFRTCQFHLHTLFHICSRISYIHTITHTHTHTCVHDPHVHSWFHLKTIAHTRSRILYTYNHTHTRTDTQIHTCYSHLNTPAHTCSMFSRGAFPLGDVAPIAATCMCVYVCMCV